MSERMIKGSGIRTGDVVFGKTVERMSTKGMSENWKRLHFTDGTSTPIDKSERVSVTR